MFSTGFSESGGFGVFSCFGVVWGVFLEVKTLVFWLDLIWGFFYTVTNTELYQLLNRVFFFLIPSSFTLSNLLSHGWQNCRLPFMTFHFLLFSLFFRDLIKSSLCWYLLSLALALLCCIPCCFFSPWN